MDSKIKNGCFINGVLYRCRTCFNPGSAVYSLKDECSDKKTCRELLKEVAQLQTHEDDPLPNTVCSKCLDKLIVFHDFILQIKRVNKKYLELLATSTDPLLDVGICKKIDSSSDGLNESLIDMPMEQFISEIKIENENFTPFDIILSNNVNDDRGTFMKTLGKNTNLSSSWFEEFKGTVEDESKQSFNDNIKKSSYTSSHEVDLPLKVLEIEKKKSSTEIKTIPVRNQQIGKKKNLIPSGFKFEQINNRFVCPICKQTFSLQRNCRRHIYTKHINQTKYLCGFCGKFFKSSDYLYQHIKRTHPDESIDTNTKYIERLFGNRLYSKPTAWSHVECKLCATTLTTTKELRPHLEAHCNVDTLQNLQMNDIIIQHLFPNINDINIVKQSVVKDISEKNYFKYYSVLNEYRYEMSISDTEVEDLLDETTERVGKYKCELCTEAFSFKYQVFSHLKEKHSKEKIASKCSICKLEFISTKMYEQHLLTHCYNSYKVFHCERCPGRFIWAENMKDHFCALNTLQTATATQVDILEAPVKVEEVIVSKATELLTSNNSSITVNTMTTVSKNVFSQNDEQSIHTKLLLEPSFLYYCLMCPKTFFTIAHLNDHLLHHRLTPMEMKAVESIVHSTWWPNGEKIIKCKICDLTFKTMAKLKQHFSSENPQNICADQHSLANYSITNQKGFELHLEMDSETETEDENNGIDTNTLFPYNCCMCSKSFKRKYQVSQHQRSMHNYELIELKCERCIFRTVSQKVLCYHKATQCFNVEKEYKCEQCNFKFMWKENLDNHILSFHTPNEFTNITKPTNSVVTNDIATTNDKNGDDIVEQLSSNTISNSNDCKESISSSNIKKNNKERPFKCSFCEKSFLRIYSLNIHKRLHTGNLPYKCTICQKPFNRKHHLKQHLASHTGEKPYKCNTCGKDFMCRQYLQAHRKLMGHNELWFTPDNLINTNNVKESTPKVRNKILCPQCGAYLSSRTSLTIHIRTHTGERPHKCEFCEKSFIRKCYLTDHQRVHTAERPYKCTYCEKSFSKGSKLNIHKRIHTGERPYKCTFCEKSFNNSNNFRLHLRLHTGEKPYRCDVCGGAFLCGRYLRKHRIKKGHHEEKN